METPKKYKYRPEIDGLRAIAVLPVIFFHFGLMPNGYLGVDIFFVISGYLITGIIYKQILSNSFSIKNFYIKRTRRILPLVSFICLVALVIGIFTMLPDDLENLSQSIIATNFFSNNILQILTTKNYWDVVNEFKPLMHTWSLAIEEQYYLFYPFIFLIIGKKRISWLLPILVALTIVSIILYFLNYPEYQKFYLLQFRFFELSIGGIAAILFFGRTIKHSFNWLIIVSLCLLLVMNIDFLNDSIKLLLSVILTVLVLISNNSSSKTSKYILENKVFILLGKISFSLYMWHQIVLAYSRYFIFKELNTINLSIVFIITIVLSYLSYKFIETPFRLSKRLSNTIVLSSILIVTLFTTGVSFFIYNNAGVIRDIPELGIKTDHIEKNMHAKYNDRVYAYNEGFKKDNSKIKVLVLGNSFARDWANILIESKFNSQIQLTYIYDPQYSMKLQELNDHSDFIFSSALSEDKLEQLKIPIEKLWVVGTKNFGVNNGYFYNYSGDDYCEQRTTMEDGYLRNNNNQKTIWGEKYIDLIQPIINDKDNTVPVFTPNCKFISQDCRHLTQDGGVFYANLMHAKIAEILTLRP